MSQAHKIKQNYYRLSSWIWPWSVLLPNWVRVNYASSVM